MILYQREYDLTQYNSEVLKKYNLETKRYIYIGATTQKMYDRNAKWRYSILTNQFCVSKEIKQFIHNIKRFYKYELDMLNDEINSIKGNKIAIKDDDQPLIDVSNSISSNYVEEEEIKIEILSFQ